MMNKKLTRCMKKRGFTYERGRWGMPDGHDGRMIVSGVERLLEIPIDELPRILAMDPDKQDTCDMWLKLLAMRPAMYWVRLAANPLLEARLEAGV